MTNAPSVEREGWSCALRRGPYSAFGMSGSTTFSPEIVRDHDSAPSRCAASDIKQLLDLDGPAVAVSHRHLCPCRRAAGTGHHRPCGCRVTPLGHLWASEIWSGIQRGRLVRRVGRTYIPVALAATSISSSSLASVLLSYAWSTPCAMSSTACRRVSGRRAVCLSRVGVDVADLADLSPRKAPGVD